MYDIIRFKRDFETIKLKSIRTGASMKVPPELFELSGEDMIRAMIKGDYQLKQVDARNFVLRPCCDWKWNQEKQEYDTTCGHGHAVIGDGTVPCDGFSFCPYCGHQINLGEEENG